MNNPIIQTIHARRSVGNLTLPMPNPQELQEVLMSAMAAPDHKQLKPWRFWVLTENALVSFGEILLQATQLEAEKSNQILDELTIKRTLNTPLRAPMIIAIATQPKYHEKVPEFEQILSTGAAAQNMLLTLESLGYKSVWRTGLLCNHPVVKSYFGLSEDDTLCGFIYTGSSDVQIPPRENFDLTELVEYRSI